MGKGESFRGSPLTQYFKKIMKFARYTFLIAGIYGIIALLPQYFLEQQNNINFPPAITHPEYFYGFIGVALAWQFAFLIIAKNPVQYRLLMLPAVFEKASFGIAVSILYAMDRMAAFLFYAGVVDLVLGALFVISFFKTSTEINNA
jgi:hypothetical protein